MKKTNSNGVTAAVKFKKIRSGALGTLTLSFLCCLTAGLAGIFGVSAAGLPFARADASGNINVGSLFKGNNPDRAVLEKFYNALSEDKSVSSIAEVERSLTNSKGTLDSEELRALNNNNDTLVTMGADMEWTVTYVSHDANGNVIATLWLNDGGHTFLSPYSGGYTGGRKLQYPGDLYSSSYIRSLLNGTTYITTTSTSTVLNSAYTVTSASQYFINSTGKGQNAKYKSFIENFGEYMVTPKDVSWQINPTEESNEKCGWLGGSVPSNSLLNSTFAIYGNATNGDKTSNDYTAKGNAANGTQYDAWGNDYFWLPSRGEVGHGEDGSHYIGLWATSINQRKSDTGVKSGNLNTSTVNGSYNHYWLRSGAVATENYVHWVQANGTVGASGDPYVCCAVRPAFHLNLTALENATKQAQDNKDLENAWNNAVNESLISGGKQVAFNLTHDWIATEKTDGAEGRTYFGEGVGFDEFGRIFVPAGANVKINLNGYTIDRNLISKEAQANGNVMYINGSLEIDDSTGRGRITGGNSNMVDVGSEGWGGCICADGGTLVITNGNITGNWGRFGGGIFAANKAKIIINGGTVSYNKSLQHGGGIYVFADCILELNGGTISGNTALGDGGGIAFSDAYGVINGGTLHGNSARDGGAMDLVRTTCVMNGGVITDNVARDGGIYIHIKNEFILNGGTIGKNRAVQGGGVYADKEGNSITINGGEISQNTVQKRGGGIYSESPLTINGGKISENNAMMSNEFRPDSEKVYGGGGVFIDGAPMLMYNGEVSENNADAGGGFYLMGEDCKSVIYGGNITYNFSTRSQGGGIYTIESATLTVWDGNISYNYIKNAQENVGGGAIYLTGSSTVTVNGGTFTGNHTDNTGSAICISKGAKALNFNGGIVSGNYSTNSPTNTASVAVYHMTGPTSTSQVNISGGVIAGNYNQNNKNADFFPGGARNTFNVSGKLASGTKIGLYPSLWGAAISSGYTTKGNAVSDASKYFFANVGVLSNAGGEVVLTTGGDNSFSNAVWTYTDGTETVTANGNYVSVPYQTGKVWTVTSTAAITSVKDAAGRPVSVLTNVGKYTFITNTNIYFTFEILPEDISGAEVNVATLVYNGEALTPKTTVTLNGVTLTKGTDYALEYSNNVNAGDNAVVTVRGLGNYSGVINKKFTIEQRNLNLRWGNLQAMFDGTAKSATAIVEGAVQGDPVSAVLAYTTEEDEYVSPVNAGFYYVYATFSAGKNYKLAQNVSFRQSFEIKRRPVDVYLESDSGVYTGESQEINAYYTDVKGDKQNIGYTLSGDITGGFAVKPGVYTVNVAAVSSDGNYIVSGATQKISYEIKRAPLTGTWGDVSFVYDGEIKEPVLTLDGGDGTVSYQYYIGIEDSRFDVKDSVSYIKDAGTYTVRAFLSSSNYVLTDDKGEEVEFLQQIITVEKGTLAPDVAASAEYSGNALSPFTETLGSGFIVTFEKDGAEIEGLPVDAGEYSYTVTDEKGNYNDYNGTFTVTRKTIVVDWSHDGFAMEQDGKFTWLYDGKYHLPKATITDGNREVPGIKVDVEQKSVGDYTATATLPENGNYVLQNATKSFGIIKSRVTALQWRQKDGSAIADRDKLSYQWIAVYGANGPGLKAFGVLTAAGSGVSFVSEKQAVIELDVKYNENDGYNPGGYWVTEETADAEKQYVAKVALKSGDTADCNMTNQFIADNTRGFNVTKLVISTDIKYATVYWIIESVVGGVPKHTVLGEIEETDNGDGTKSYSLKINGECKFKYNGSEQAPKAIVAFEGYDPEAPSAGSFAVLEVHGGQTDAGVYHAFISSDVQYNVRPEIMMFGFEIEKLIITSIEWSGNADNGGKFEWQYDGLMHGPTAQGRTDDGVACPVTVTGAINAGVYRARLTAGRNYEFAAEVEGGLEHEYTVNKFNIDKTQIVWDTTGGTAKTDENGTYYEYIYDGVTLFGPTASFTVEINGAKIGGTLTVIGRTSAEGMHYVYAFIPTTANPVFANLSLEMKDATCRFSVRRASKHEVHWSLSEGGAEETGNLFFTYDGVTDFKPYAYFIDDEGNKVGLNVLGSGMQAGVYTAEIFDNDYPFANGVKKNFTVLRVTVKVNLVNGSFVYDGKAHSPEITLSIVNGEPTAERLDLHFEITSAIEAGAHTAVVTLLDRNYVLQSNTVEFNIAKQSLQIVWDEKVTFEYKDTVYKPGISAINMNGAAVNLPDATVTVTGAEKNVGVYTAHAVIDNPNYVLNNADIEFEITPFEITVEWTGTGEDGDVFEWQYDSEKINKPTASFTDWKGDKTDLTVVGGGIDAGEYTATAIAPVNCKFKFTTGENASERAYKIIAGKITSIIWEAGAGLTDDGEGGYYYEYDGNTPVIEAYVDNGGVKGEKLVITGVGIDANTYTATALPRNAANIAFDGVSNTLKITVNPKEVSVEWTASKDVTVSASGEYIWAYDGAVHTLTASIEGVNGKIQVPVSGGEVSAVGEYTATAVDVLNNYSFTEASAEKQIIVKAKTVEFEWTAQDGTYNADDDSYEFVYNGRAQIPTVNVTTEGVSGLTLVYRIYDDGFNPVKAAINAGTYYVYVSAAIPSNYAFDENDADENGDISVTIIIKRKEVSVKWGALRLVYSGSAQAPEAWFTDVNNQLVKLAVSGAQTEVGTGYSVTADFVNASLAENYSLTDEQSTFAIEKQFMDKVEWDWENGEWKDAPQKTDPDDEEQTTSGN